MVGEVTLGHNPFGVEGFWGPIDPGLLADSPTLGFEPESLWDSYFLPTVRFALCGDWAAIGGCPLLRKPNGLIE